MQLISLELLMTIVTLLSTVSVVTAKKGKGSKCSTCKEIVKNFAQGVDRTKKSNYGGGNTEWEESRLGQYANSEVRLVEIMEILCFQASQECPQMVEQHENIIEDFWLKSGLEKAEQEFYNYFCIENVKACCPNNTYGPECEECPGGKERPCKNNGKCLGAGTRSGSGKCKCHPGYKGKLCDNCATGYYESSKNDTHSLCKVCHISCKTSCTGDGPTQCDACRNGWTHNEETGCQDVNECENNPCSYSEYCVNTEGSYTCMSCNVACDGCTGLGPDKCVNCKSGYHKKDGNCVDVDECTAEGHEQLCALEGQKCENTVGSFKCGCRFGYLKDGAICRPKPEEELPDDDAGGEEDNTLQPDQDPSQTKNLDTDTPKEEL